MISSPTSYAEPESTIAKVLGKRAIVYLGILLMTLVLLLVLNAGEASAAGPTYVYDDIASDTNWTADDSPYIVNQSISIQPGVTLTIEPNVTVMFDNGVGLTIFGTLDAQGAAEEEIIFTSNGSTTWGAWDGLLFNEMSTGSVLDNVYIQYADSPVYISESSVTMSNLRISDYVGGGVYDQSAIYWESMTDSITATLSNIQIWNGSYTGIILLSEEGDVDLTLTDVIVKDITFATGLGIVANNSLRVNVNNFTTINMGWRGVVLVSYEGEIDADFSSVVMNGLISDGFHMYSKGVTTTFNNIWVNDSHGSGVWMSLAPDDTGIDLAFADVTLTNISNYGVYMESPSNGISLEMNDVTMGNIGSSGLRANAHDDIYLQSREITIINSSSYGMHLFTTNGTIMAEITNLTAFVNGSGVYARAQDGDVLLSIDPSFIQADIFGVFIEGWNVSTTVEDTVIEGGQTGIYVIGGTEMVLEMANCTIDNCQEYGVMAHALDADVHFIMEDSTLNGTINEEGVSILSQFGDVWAQIENTSFTLNLRSINMESTEGDVQLGLKNCSFDGDLESSVTALAGGDVDLEITDTDIYGGSGSDAWYFFEEMEYEFEILDPEFQTSGSWYMIPLPWEVPFNGEMWDMVYVYRWGYITLGSYVAGPTNLTGSVPMIAPCQEVFDVDDYPQYGHTFYDDRLVFQWDVYVSGESSHLRNVFELVIYLNGDIQFNYAEMESVSHDLYDWGINMDASNSLLMDYLWKADPFDNDWTSYLFKYKPLSSGWGVNVEAEGNCTATITGSSIGGYHYAGALLVSEGWMRTSATDTSFYDIFGGEETSSSLQTGGLLAMSLNGTIEAVVEGCDFTKIAGTGAVFSSRPLSGGSDLVSIVNNTFIQVTKLSAGSITSIEDEDGMNSEVDYEAEHLFIDNVGIGSGSLLAFTNIESSDSAWNVTLSDVIQGNSFTGYIIQYLPVFPREYAYVAAWVHTEMNGSQAHLNAIVTDNNFTSTIVGWVFSEGMTVSHNARVWHGTFDMSSSIKIIDNIMVSEKPLMFGISVTVNTYLDTGELDALADVQISGNTFETTHGEYGLALQMGILPTSEHYVGNGTFGSNTVIEGNTISGFEIGVLVEQWCYSHQRWGDILADFDTRIVGNTVIATKEGIIVTPHAQCGFTDYFPSYEQEISSHTSMNKVLTIMDNTIVAVEVGVHTIETIKAQEGGKGTFANALCTVTEEVMISGNDIESGKLGIWLFDDEASIDGEAKVQSIRLVEVSDNTITCNGDLESSVYGIALSQSIFSLTEQLEFDDAPSIENVWAVAVHDNLVQGFSNGINVSHFSEAMNGMSSIDNLVEMDIIGNEVIGCESWGIIGYIFSNTTQYSYGSLENDPSINLTTSILIQENLVSLVNEVSGMDIDHGIYGGISCLTDHIYEQGDLEILDNEVIGSATGLGISVYSRPSSDLNFTVARNLIDSFSTGIEADHSEVVIEGNTITNMAYSGVYLFKSTGTIMDNEIDCEYRGLDITYSSDALIYGNSIVNTMNSGTGFGIYMDFCENMTISECSISLFGFGVYLVYVDDSLVQDNLLEVLGNSGMYAFDSDGLIISSNIITGTLNDGILLELCDQTEISFNEIYDVGIDCVHLTDCDDLLFADNTIHDALDDGLEMNSCSDAVLINNIFYDCVDHGVYASSGSMMWIVDGVAEVRNCLVSFRGDVIVAEQGTLTLNSVDGFVLFYDAHDGIPALVIEEGGLLEAVNSHLGSNEETGALPPMIVPWLFDVFGEMNMESCVVMGAYQLYCAPTSAVVVHSSVIKDGRTNGVYVDNCSPVIAGTNITENNGDGIYIVGEEAEPDITNCLISENERGIYAHSGSLGKVIDNLIFYNDMTGIYADSVVGEIHDNILLFNQREIFILDSTIDLRDNQIGYSILIDIMSEYWPLFVEMEYPAMPQFSFEPEDILSMMTNHIGVYAEDSVIDARDNYYGMLSYAVYLVDTEMLFKDSVEMSTLVIPYATDGGDTEMSLPIFVNDGIFASGSLLLVEESFIEVLDDAIFLEASEAEIEDSELISGDLDIYAVGGTLASVYSTSLDGVKAEDDSVVSVFATLTVYTVDREGGPSQGIPVTVSSSDGTVVAEGNSTAEGEFIATVMAAQYTSEGENATTNPYTASAEFPAGWTNRTVEVDGPTEITLMEPDGGPHYREGSFIAMAVIAGILVFIGLLTLAARP